jgi:hypothetical protein
LNKLAHGPQVEGCPDSLVEFSEIKARGTGARFGGNEMSERAQPIIDITIEASGEGDVEKTAEGDQENPQNENVPEGEFKTQTSENHLFPFHHITNPPDRMDQLGVKILVDLLPEIIDVNINHVRIRVEVVVPDMF